MNGAEVRERVTVAAIVKALRAKPAEWRGNCHGVATVVAAMIPGAKATRGFWTGSIAPRSFFGARRGVGFTGHSWVTTKDGLTVDPTRWVFEDVPPYIFVGRRDPDAFVCDDFEASANDEFACKHCDCDESEHEDSGMFRPCRKCCAWPYDAGGNAVRAAFMRPPPKVAEGAERPERLSLDFDALERVRVLLGDTSVATWARPAEFTRDQVFWLANAPLPALEPFEIGIYAALAAAGHEVWIPIDNFREVTERADYRAALARCKVRRAVPAKQPVAPRSTGR